MISRRALFWFGVGAVAAAKTTGVGAAPTIGEAGTAYEEAVAAVMSRNFPSEFVMQTNGEAAMARLIERGTSRLVKLREIEIDIRSDDPAPDRRPA